MKDLTISTSVSKFIKPTKFSFVCKLIEEERTKEEAQSKLENLVNSKVKPFLDKLQIDQDSFVGEYSFSGKYSSERKNKNILTISQTIASYHLTFESTSVDKVKDLYDLIVSEPKAEVLSVAFGFANLDEIEKELLKKALDKAIVQRNVECEIMGEKTEDLKVMTWKSEIKDVRESGLVNSNTTGFHNDNFILTYDPKPIKLTLNLSVTYSK